VETKNASNPKTITKTQFCKEKLTWSFKTNNKAAA